MRIVPGPSTLTRTLYVLLAAAALAVPFAAASDHGEPGPDDHVIVLADASTPEGRYYVVEDHGAISLWRETNGVETGGVARLADSEASGVQTAWFCLQDDGAVVYVWPDEGCATGIPTPPDMRITNGALLGILEDMLPEHVHDLVHDIEHELEHVLP